MKTIRQQLTRNLLISVGLLLGAAGVTVYFCARTALQRQFDTALQTKAYAIASLTEPKHHRLEIEFSDEHMRGFEQGDDGLFELRETSGRSVERSRSLGDIHIPFRPGTPERPAFWNLALPDGRAFRAVSFRFHPQDSDEDRRESSEMEAILVVASARRTLDRTLATLQLILAGGGLLLLAATAVVVPLVLRRELQPLQTLADEAARIDAGSLSARFPTEDLPVELSPIVARLNELLARLEDSFGRERRFSSDVAHEFRTPVAELRTLAELAIKLPDTRAANADQETLAIALHLESILTRLLALSRGERGGLAVQIECVGLEPLLCSVCDKFRERAADGGLELRVNAPAGAQVETDPVLLRAILTNLVDNAVTYTPRGGVVDVEMSLRNGGITARVVNTVSDLVERDLSHLFERFWRKDAARSADGHSGLGLSLAQTFARTIGLEIQASLIEPTRLALILKPTQQVD